MKKNLTKSSFKFEAQQQLITTNEYIISQLPESYKASLGKKQNLHFLTIVVCYKMETLTNYTTKLLLKVIGDTKTFLNKSN